MLSAGQYVKHLRAPDDDPDIVAFPVPPAQIQRRTRLAGLINEYQHAT